MKPIQNFEDLKDFLLNESDLAELMAPDEDGEQINMQPTGNAVLDQYIKTFGNLIKTISSQDEFDFDFSPVKNNNNLPLRQFIIENQYCWILATLPGSTSVYCNDWHHLSEEGNKISFDDFQLMEYDLEECLITYTLQEVYFYEGDSDLALTPQEEADLSRIFFPIWKDKRYAWNEPISSFYYNKERRTLVYNNGAGAFIGVRCWSTEDED